MRKPGYRVACMCLMLSLCACNVLAEPAWVKTGKGALNARRKANAKADIVIKIPNGSEVDLLEENGDWSRVEYKGKKGYVKSSFLSHEAPQKEEEPVMLVIQEGGCARIVTQGGTLNLRQKADAKSAVVAQAPNGARVEVVQASLEWTSIICNGKKGYVRTEYLVLDSQMTGRQIYPDGDYLHVRAEQSASSVSLASVSAAQPMTIVSIGDEWLQVQCEDPLNGQIQGYVRMEDVSQWREAPSQEAKAPVYVRADVSRDTLLLGQELDVMLSCKEDAVCRIRIDRDGKTVMKERPLTSRVFSYRPREAGNYQMELIVTEPDGGTIGREIRFSVDVEQMEQEDGFVLYSQKDGWWLDKKYSRSNLDQSGCALFTLSHAMQLLGKASEKTEPAVLGRDYAAYLAESGTVTSNLLAAASRNFGFRIEKDKIGDSQRIAQLFCEGAVFSFAIVNGHIALAAGLSEDGTKVRVIDSAPSATMERIENASMYLPDGQGGFKTIASLWDVPGARYYPETDQFSGMEYYLDLSYVASRGVRLIQAK